MRMRNTRQNVSDYFKERMLSPLILLPVQLKECLVAFHLCEIVKKASRKLLNKADKA